MPHSDLKQLEAELRKPFAYRDVQWKPARRPSEPRNPGDTPAMKILAFVDARAIADRLDDLFGIDGWKDEYAVVDVGTEQGMICRLSVRIGDVWITKEGAAPATEIEAIKGAESDALKRAASKFGIGRYLYEMPPTFAVWREGYVDDAPWHQIKVADRWWSWRQGTMPAWALPPDADPRQITPETDSQSPKTKARSKAAKQPEIAVEASQEPEIAIEDQEPVVEEPVAGKSKASTARKPRSTPKSGQAKKAGKSTSTSTPDWMREADPRKLFSSVPIESGPGEGKTMFDLLKAECQAEGLPLVGCKEGRFPISDHEGSLRWLIHNSLDQWRESESQQERRQAIALGYYAGQLAELEVDYPPTTQQQAMMVF